MEDKQRLAADERELVVFDFSSTNLCEDTENLVSESVLEALQVFKETIAEESDNKFQFENQIKELHKYYMAKAKNPLAKFKNEVQKLMAVPTNFMVPDKNFKKYSNSDVEALIKENEKLEKELLRENLFLKKCKQNKAVIENIKPLYEKLDVLIPLYKEKTQELEQVNSKKLNESLDEFANFLFVDPDQSESIDVMLTNDKFQPKN